MEIISGMLAIATFVFAMGMISILAGLFCSWFDSTFKIAKTAFGIGVVIIVFAGFIIFISAVCTMFA